MSEKETGGQAFPCTEYDTEYERYFTEAGMTLRQYAAIKLKVPDSGTDWLDGMITQSLRNDFAAKTVQALVSSPHCAEVFNATQKVKTAYAIADELLKTRNQ